MSNFKLEVDICLRKWGKSNFPEITYEIKTDEPGPYEWSWEIKWVAMACPQAEGKNRFKANKQKVFTKSGKAQSSDKTWKAILDEVVGGELTVRVKAGNTLFVRKTFIRGKNPSMAKIHAEIDTYENKQNAALVKKIFQQESRYRHFYSDGMPLASFDNGYGLGQLTNPEPTYEQVWNWKKHVKEMMDKRVPAARAVAEKYLNKHKGYTQEISDLETLASYNGLPQKQRFHNWDEKNNVWVVNDKVICDPDQSNKGWNLEKELNKGKTLTELKKGEGSKPFYTGRCYAEHIQHTQK